MKAKTVIENTYGKRKLMVECPVRGYKVNTLKTCFDKCQYCNGYGIGYIECGYEEKKNSDTLIDGALK